MLVLLNENPDGNRTTDCTIRALSTLLDQDWETTFIGIALVCLDLHEMPERNTVWSKYLRDRGYVRHALPDTCPDCYTVGQFAQDHPTGEYLVACDGHVVCVRHGDVYDTFDSQDMTAIYYWQKEM